MRLKGLFQKGPRGGDYFTALDERAKEILAKLKPGDKVFLWVHKARYPEHHRLSMAVIQKIADAIGQPHELLLTWIKRETGRFDWVRLLDGTTEKSYHSIAFESMDQEDFQSFWNDTLVLLSEKVFGKLDSDLLDEIRSMLAGKVDLN
jgi:hypothetical protein